MATAKKAVIKKHQQHDKDTGSARVQVALFTDKIANLSEHLQTHKKDLGSRRGLIGLVGKRRNLLKYLKMNDPKEYDAVIKELGLRK